MGGRELAERKRKRCRELSGEVNSCNALSSAGDGLAGEISLKAAMETAEDAEDAENADVGQVEGIHV